MLKAPDIPSIRWKRRLSATLRRSASCAPAISSSRWQSRFWRASRLISPTAARWRADRSRAGRESGYFCGLQIQKHPSGCLSVVIKSWLRRPDLNRRPSGYEPDELPLLHPASVLMLYYYETTVSWYAAGTAFGWLRGPDLNRRPSGYEPDELPGCSTPRPYNTLLSKPNTNTANAASVGCGGRI